VSRTHPSGSTQNLRYRNSLLLLLLLCPPLRFTPKLPPFVRQPSKEEQLALKLTYEERIEHKLWKVRQTAFVELGRLFADESESDNRDNIYANITQR